MRPEIVVGKLFKTLEKKKRFSALTGVYVRFAPKSLHPRTCGGGKIGIVIGLC
jgi:hypothetical protein